MKITYLLLGMALTLAAPAWAQIDADHTRYDNTKAASFHRTIDLSASGAAADSIVWFGFEAWTFTVIRMNNNVIVTPITVTDLLTDGNSLFGGRNIANPRAG